MSNRVTATRDRVQATETARKWRANNRTKDSSSSRKHRYKKLYKLSVEEYETLLDSQEGCCKICGTHCEKLKTRLHVDHCHVTGDVRGLLCRKCNLMLGHANDDPDILKNALLYLGEKIAT
jgi:hypothetical protein